MLKELLITAGLLLSSPAAIAAPVMLSSEITTDDSIHRSPPVFKNTEFGDYAILNNKVSELLYDACNEVATRNTDLEWAIDARLDYMADGTKANRQIKDYWMLFYPDRLVLYVNPMNSNVYLVYTIMNADVITEQNEVKNG